MKYNISVNNDDYNDEVIFDLLRFLNEKLYSKRNIESFCSDLDYPMTSSIDLLFDKNQSISFCNLEYDISLKRIENNKLLVIVSSSDEIRSFYGFTLLDNAKKFTISVNKQEKIIELSDGHTTSFSYSSILDSSLIELPNEIKIEKLQEVPLSQLIERGCNNKKLIKKMFNLE